MSIGVSCVSRVSCALPLHVSLQSVICPACPACSPLFSTVHWSLCAGMAVLLYPSSYQVAGPHLEQCDPMSAADVEPGTAAVIFQIKQQTSMRSVIPFRASVPSCTAAFHMALGTCSALLLYYRWLPRGLRARGQGSQRPQDKGSRRRPLPVPGYQLPNTHLREQDDRCQRKVYREPKESRKFRRGDPQDQERLFVGIHPRCGVGASCASFALALSLSLVTV